jgi:hypothetical protein
MKKSNRPKLTKGERAIYATINKQVEDFVSAVTLATSPTWTPKQLADVMKAVEKQKKQKKVLPRAS